MMSSNTKTMGSHQLPATPLDRELVAKRAAKIKVSMISLCGCSGCTLSFLDVDERLLALLDKITIHRSSLTVIKRITQRCAIGFIEGGDANEETSRHPSTSAKTATCGSRWAPARSGRCPRDAQHGAAQGLPGRGVRRLSDRSAGAQPVVPLHRDLPVWTPSFVPATRW